MAIRGANLTFGGGEKIWGRKKPIRKTKKKWRPFFVPLGAPFFCTL